MLGETQTDSFQIWTWAADLISFDDNCYTEGLIEQVVGACTFIDVKKSLCGVVTSMLDRDMEVRVFDWLVGWLVLWRINICRLFNAKSIFM